MNTQVEQTIESPCIGICDTAGTDICHGCYRSLDEIVIWGQATAMQKSEILRRAQKRRQQIPPSA